MNEVPIGEVSKMLEEHEARLSALELAFQHAIGILDRRDPGVGNALINSLSQPLKRARANFSDPLNPNRASLENIIGNISKGIPK